MIKKEMIAMLLAGGQGSRLGVLTQKVAKPAVSFGGKYRIIDFPLSNCINSGVDTVGVLTQYQPLRLNAHIGIGIPWDLDRNVGGVTVLPPYEKSKGSDWYTGTANAIYQNLEYMENYNPEYVLILSGDHIYKMDYEEMLEKHKENDASLTVAVLEVPMKDASRFGIMNTDKNDRIIEFDEKPAEPKSNLASMGIYIFDWARLRSVLLSNYTKDGEMVDFGKHVIPSYLESGDNVFAYRFSGYWKDVGTIDSLWEANMEFIDPQMELGIRDKNWQVFSKNPIAPPHFITETGSAKNSLIMDGCYVAGDIEHSILSENVQVKEGTKITDSVVMPGAVIGKNVTLKRAIIGENAVIGDDAVIDGTDEIAVVGYSEVIGVTIDEN